MSHIPGHMPNGSHSVGAMLSTTPLWILHPDDPEGRPLDFQLLFINNLGQNLSEFPKDEKDKEKRRKIGFHLTVYPKKKGSEKRFAIAFDVVPWVDHEEAEKAVQQQLGIRNPIEELDPSLLESVADLDPKHQSIIEQTCRYARSQSFDQVFRQNKFFRGGDNISNWIENKLYDFRDFGIRLSSESGLRP
jgi:hypothetical protein